MSKHHPHGWPPGLSPGAGPCPAAPRTDTPGTSPGRHRPGLSAPVYRSH